MLRSADARQQAGGRGNDNLRGASGQRMQSASPGGRDIHVRREPAIRIHLMGWERQDGALRVRIREALERGDEEAHIAGHPLDVAVRRYDQQHAIAVRGVGYVQRFRGR